MKNILKPVHAGDILFEEFMQPYKLTEYKLSQITGISQTHIGRIIKGKRSVTVDTALRLAKVFNTSPEFWLNIQNKYDLDTMKIETKEAIKKIQPIEKYVLAKC
ncbi:HigA family addiction module antidote protein [Treponema sp. OMZ 788]|uniref:HigA family addiction module antitoxin n=1 Tax=Treponema sp. OMZ 788 TaxID=2563664 RepID=UPI0020A448EC|nr:HigA family addiction module antitoxin [Treponema sp. OMZ 788]UTC65661.1 HigA family addiction module antidote protein [Treponema sp. OMZ 788]